MIRHRFSRLGLAAAFALGFAPGCDCGGDDPPADPTSSSSGTSVGGGGAGADGGAGASGGGGQGGGGDGGDGGNEDPGCQADSGQTRAVDLVLAIDNSRSMADKQAILALTVPDLVQAFINPLCVDGTGAPSAMQPAKPSDPCPDATTTRDFEPVQDLHIGIVSSSIGGHGSDACPGNVGNNDDRGHLLDRKLGGGTVATYQGKKFLAWDPSCKLDPEGETSPGDLVDAVTEMVTGVDQVGCGFESQLESMYRFLADPNPYDSIPVVNGIATPTGTDAVLLQQRKDFLRPNSLLAVVMFTDENDCSIRESGQYFFAAQLKSGNSAFHLPRARQECAVDPSDPCCKSCGQSPGNCPADAGCEANPMLSDLEDPANLRCFHQKRRFGIDFLYPVDRYVEALTSTTITDSSGNTVPNPIFSDLDPSDGITEVRDPSLVFMMGILGVPWQDIARDPGELGKGYRTAAELAQVDASGQTRWDVVLGDPASWTMPLDPLMRESIDPRMGVNPVTGDPVVGPTQPLGNPINGNEYTNAQQSDLQFACVFRLLAPRDCTDPAQQMAGCDCTDPNNDSPLCEADPANAGQRTKQVRGKAYPSLRELEVLKGLGPQAAVASICAEQTNDPGGVDYAYRPAVRALLDATRAKLE